MTTTPNAKEILTEFIREVWSEGNADASDKYVAPKYKILHDPGDIEKADPSRQERRNRHFVGGIQHDGCDAASQEGLARQA